MTMRSRNRAQAGELLDRLMRGAILAQGDAVVGEDVDHVQSHQRGETDRRAHVIGEDQERRAERNGAAVRGEAVHDRAHAVLAHAEVQIAAGVAPAAAVGALRVGADVGRLEIAHPLSAV